MPNHVPRDGTQADLGRSDKPWGTGWINVVHGTADASLRAGTASLAEAFSGTAVAALTAGTAQAALVFSGTAPYALVAGTVYGMGTGTSSGTGDYATLAGTAITFSGTAPAATQAGTAQWAMQAGTAIYALSGGTGGPAVGGTADFAAISGTALNFFGTASASATAGTAQAALTFSGTAPYATSAGTALVFSGTSGAASYAASAGTASVFAGTAPYAVRSGTAYYADNAQVLHGFVDRTSTAISASGGSFYLSGSAYTVWHSGVGISVTGTLSAALPTDQTLYYNSVSVAGTLAAGTDAWDILTGCPVAMVYRDGTKYSVQEERHNYMRNRAWHNWAHKTVGARYDSGLSGSFSGTWFSIATGAIADEDITNTMATAGTTCALWRRTSGGAKMTFEPTSGTLFALAGSVLGYDSAGTVTAASINNFVNSYVYATNDINYPIFSIVGQAQHTVAGDANNEALPTIPNLSSREWKLLYRVTYKRTASAVTLQGTADFRETSTGPAATVSSGDHNLLTGRSDAAQHPASSISVTTADLGTGWAGTDNTVQLALVALDRTNTSGTVRYAVNAGTAANLSGTAPYALGAGSWWGWNGTASAFSGTSPAAVRAGTASSAENFSGTAVAATNAGTAQVAQFVSYASGVIYAGSALTLPGTNLTAVGLITSQTVGEAVGFGNVLFMGSDGAFYKADADQASTMPIAAMALGTCGSASACPLLHYGWVRNDAWHFTKGALAYADTASGSLAGTSPTGSGDQVQVGAIAYGTGKLFFCPSPVLVEIT